MSSSKLNKNINNISSSRFNKVELNQNEILAESISGRIIDARTKEPLNSVKATLSTKNLEIYEETLTNKEGLFTFNFNYDIKKFRTENNKIKLNIFPNPQIYKYQEIIPIDVNYNILKNIPPIELEHIKSIAGELLTQASRISKKSIDNFKKRYKKDVEWLEKFFNDSVSKINKNMITPMVIMLAKFGIQKLGEKKITCPPKNELNEIIRKRNTIVNGLNVLYKSLDILVKSNTVFESLIVLYKITNNILLNLPTPIVKYMPQSIILKKARKIEYINNFITKYQGISSIVLIHILILRDLIKQVLDILKQLDNNIKECYSDQVKDITNSYETNYYLEELNKDLRDLNELDKEEDNIVNYFNGFKLEVINVEKNHIRDFYRRQAVAINPQGIIVLRGEPSFSSSDRILIEELIFYINTNNLKAD